MFKSYAIEYGSYVLFGLFISAIQNYTDVDILTAWGFILIGMLYSSVIIPVIRYAAWGEEHD
jgi:hypothetical protein